MPYTPLSLALVWGLMTTIVVAVVAGAGTGLGLAALTLLALIIPPVILRRVPRRVSAGTLEKP